MTTTDTIIHPTQDTPTDGVWAFTHDGETHLATIDGWNTIDGEHQLDVTVEKFNRATGELSVKFHEVHHLERLHRPTVADLVELDEQLHYDTARADRLATEAQETADRLKAQRELVQRLLGA